MNIIKGNHFCSVCLNFFMILLNMVSIARSRSDSRTHEKNNEKRLISEMSFVILV